jgi:hypothetical protein
MLREGHSKQTGKFQINVASVNSCQNEEAVERAIDDFMRSPRLNGRKALTPSNPTTNGSFLANRTST